MTDIEQLLAIEEIKKLKARYFRCMDKKDWAGFLAVFTPDAVVDSTGAFTPTDYRGDPLGDVVASPPVGVDLYATDIVKFVEGMSAGTGRVSTVHQGHMPEIDITSPTTARGIWAMEDVIRLPEGGPLRALHGFGHYEETYERLPDGWRIKSLKLTRLRIDQS